MNKQKRVLMTLLLSLMLVLLVAGCGKKKVEDAKFDKNSVFKEEELNFQFPNGFDISGVEVAGEKIIFYGYSYNYEEDDYGFKWGISDLDGTNMRIVPFGGENTSASSPVILGDDKIALTSTEYKYIDDGTEYGTYEQNCNLHIYNLNAELLNTVDLHNEYGIDYVDTIMPLNDGNIVINSYEKYLLLNAEGEKIKEVQKEGDEWFNFQRIKDGTYIAICWGDNGREIKRFSTDTFKAGEKIEAPFPLERYGLYSATNEYDMILSSQGQLWGWNIGDAEPTLIIDFVNSDLSTSYLSNFVYLSEGTYLGSYYEWSETEGRNVIAKFTKVDPSTIVEKKYLTLGCLYLNNNIRTKVVKFNKTSDEYRIIINDYSKYDSQDDWSAGENRLNSDIASGQAPDIVIVNSQNAVNYIKKGLFKDLTGYLDNDPDIDKNDIFPNLLEACSDNGKLYGITPSFSISTVVGKTANLGGKTSWNFDEFNEFRQSIPENAKLFDYGIRENLLYNILSANFEEYVDMKKAQCHFDSPEFISLLTVLKEFPSWEDNDAMDDDYDYMLEESAYRDNRTMLMMYYIYGINDYEYLLRSTFGDDITFIGYPCKEGNGSTISPDYIYAISSKTKYADAGWDFIRIILDKEFQKDNYGQFPALMSAFDSQAEEAMKPDTYTDEDGVAIEIPRTYYIGGEEVTAEPLTKEEIDKLKAFVMSVNKLGGYMEDIETIISEEAAAFFEGQKTAEEVATIIQSRASIYIKEKQ